MAQIIKNCIRVLRNRWFLLRELILVTNLMDLEKEIINVAQWVTEIWLLGNNGMLKHKNMKVVNQLPKLQKY